MPWAVAGAAIGAYGSIKSSQNAKDAAAAGANQTGTQNGTQNGTSTTSLDPRIAQLLGTSGNGGILGGLGGTLNGGSNLSGVGNSFLNANGSQILNNGMAGTNVLQSSQYTAPTIQGAQIQAPGQNNINLSPTFQSLLGGGDNSKLLSALQAGNDLTSAQFQKNQTDLTNNLTRSVLPQIRGGAIAAGQYGSSRQGIAEGNALSDYTNQLTSANTQLGLANSANTANALAGDYQQGQNRALSAAQGLSGQQYATAGANAAAGQAADNTNVQALLATRGQNSSNLATGVGLQQGLLGSAANYGNADLTRLGQQAGILAPFLGAGATTTTNNTTNNTTTGNVSQPLYQNTAGNAIGGGLMGAQLGGQLGGLFGGGNSSQFSGSSMGGLASLFGNNSSFSSGFGS